MTLKHKESSPTSLKTPNSSHLKEMTSSLKEPFFSKEAALSAIREELPCNSVQINKQEVENMTKLSEYAESYEPASKTKNIADLKEVSTDMDLIDDEFKITDKITKQEKTVKQKVIVVNNEKYRIPASVIGQLKVILEDNPNCKKFKVKKSGTTMDDTRYMVIPLG